MNLPPEAALELWHRALEEPIGISIETSDRRWLQRTLYSARREAQQPELETLLIMMPPAQDEVWICRKDANNETQQLKEHFANAPTP